MGTSNGMVITSKGTKVLIELETAVEGHLSGTGKSTVLQSTSGFAETGIPGVRVSLNLIKKLAKTA